MIFLLERKGKTGYDECDGFVVRAKTEYAARKFVSKSRITGDEGSEIWKDFRETTCTLIEPTNKEELILRSFNGG